MLAAGTLTAPASAAGTELVYEQNFEKMLPGETLEEEFVCEIGANSEATVGRADSNQYLHLQSRNNEEVRITKKFAEPLSGIVTLEQDILIAQNPNDGHKFISLMNNDTTWVAMVLCTATDISMRYGRSGYKTLVPNYQINKWYHIKLVANTSTHKIAAYVDGKLICADVPFWNTTDSIPGINAYAQSENTRMHSCCLDNIRVTVEPSVGYMPKVSGITVSGRAQMLVSDGKQVGMENEENVRSLRFAATAVDQCGAAMEGQNIAWSIAPENAAMGFTIDAATGTVNVPETVTEDCALTVYAQADSAVGSFTTQIIRAAKIGVYDDFADGGTDGMNSDYMFIKPSGGRADLSSGDLVVAYNGEANITFPATLRNTVVLKSRIYSYDPSTNGNEFNILTCHNSDIMIVQRENTLAWRNEGKGSYETLLTDFELKKFYDIEIEVPYPSGDVTVKVTLDGGETVVTTGLKRRNGNSGMANFSCVPYKGKVLLQNLYIYEKGADEALDLQIDGAASAYIPSTEAEMKTGYSAKLSNPISGGSAAAENVTWSVSGADGVSIDETGVLTVPRGTEPGEATVTASADGKNAVKKVRIAENAVAFTGVDLFKCKDGSLTARLGAQALQSEEKPVRLIVALYDADKQLIKVVTAGRDDGKSDESQYIRAEGGVIEAKIPAEELEDAKTAQAFVWNSMDGIKPLTAPSDLLTIPITE